MATYKLDFMFSFQKFGWSEGYHFIANNLAAAERIVGLAIPKRVRLLGKDAVMTAWRMRDIDLERSSELIRLSSGTGSNAEQAAAADNVGTTDMPWTRIVVKQFLTADDVPEIQSKLLYMGGVPDSEISVNDFPAINLSPGYERLVNLWMGFLSTNDFGGMVTAPVSVNPWQTPTTVEKDATTGQVLVNIANPTIAQGDIIRFDRFDRVAYSFLKGRHKVQEKKADNTGFLLYTSYPSNFLPTVLSPVRYRKLVPLFRPVESWDVALVTHRDTGRPFDSPRGRR